MIKIGFDPDADEWRAIADGHRAFVRRAMAEGSDIADIMVDRVNDVSGRTMIRLTGSFRGQFTPPGTVYHWHGYVTSDTDLPTVPALAK